MTGAKGDFIDCKISTAFHVRRSAPSGPEHFGQRGPVAVQDLVTWPHYVGQKIAGDVWDTESASEMFRLSVQ